MRTYERKLGRPAGLRAGQKVSERKNVTFGFYPEDIQRLNKLEETLNISQAGVVRYAIERLEQNANKS